MDNNNAMTSHSNLMLVEIIYGNSGKYSQEDVLAAEIELSMRNISDADMEALKYKIAYIGGINMGNFPKSNSSASSANENEEEDEESRELEGTDSILVKVLIGYVALTSLGMLGSVFQGSLKYSVLSLASLGISVYGIYGLLNRKRLPVLLLIGLFSYGFMRTISSAFGLVLSFNLSYLIIPLIFTALGGAVLYFVTKPSMRRAYDMDVDSIKKAIGVGVVLAILFTFL